MSIKKTLRKYLSNRRISYSISGRNISLLFHYVGDRISFNAKFHAIATRDFEKLILAFKKKWDFVDEETFFAETAERKRPKILLTFDDGYKDALDNVADFLAKEKIPFIFFVNTTLIEGNTLWRDQIRAIITQNRIADFIEHSGLDNVSETDFYTQTKDPDLFKSSLIAEKVRDFCIQKNIEVSKEKDLYCSVLDIRKHLNNPYLKIGNHTSNHFVLSTLPFEEQQAEIGSCQDYLERKFGADKISRVFSTPFGSLKSYNNDTIKVLEDLGYKAILISVSNHYKSRKNKLGLTDCPIPGYKRFLPKQDFRLFT